jgi:hypothetical protein
VRTAAAILAAEHAGQAQALFIFMSGLISIGPSFRHRIPRVISWQTFSAANANDNQGKHCQGQGWHANRDDVDERLTDLPPVCATNRQQLWP